MSSDDQPIIDLGNISNLAIYLQATEKQMLAAYGRALARTSGWLKTHAGHMAKEGLQVRELKTLRKRMGYYRLPASGGHLDAVKFWLGLNSMPISQLKGKITGRGGKRHARRDKNTGRFIKRRKGSAAPVFSPAGGSLADTAFEDGYVSRPDAGRRTIFVRGKYRTREATLDIQEPMEGDVVAKLIREVPAKFMEEYEHELKYRVATNLRTDGNGRRI